MALRYSRPVKALLATGIAASTIVMSGLPAAAQPATSYRNSEWWMSALHIRNSWPTSRGLGVTVAVLSDGVDYLQPDLTGSVVTTGPDYTGTGQSSGQFFGEVGTGIAALIAGHGYGINSIDGVVGEAPLAHILSVRVTLPPDDPMLAEQSVAAGLPNAIGQGIRYAVSHGASVIDLPIDPGQPGVNGTGGASAAAGGSQAEESAVKYALSHNVVLVAPAGDDNAAGDAPNFPAAYPGVIAVGAFDQDFNKTPWTSRQSYVTVTAAGADMVVATNSGTFQTVSGTTYASAVVTGIVAMIRSRFPTLTVSEVRQALTSSTVFHGADGRADGSGYGTVDAAAALAAAAKEQASPSSLAGAGAQPLTALAAPGPQSPKSNLTHSIIRAAVIAVGLLVVLLLLVFLYVATRRRSPSAQPAVASDWHRQASRYPHASTAEADRMADFFAAPLTDPATGERAASRAPAATVGLAPGADRPSVVAGQFDDPFGSAALAPPSWESDTGGRSTVGPASKAVSRRPAVSGAPPWEEASRPDSELPWAAPAGRGPTGTRPSAISPVQPSEPAFPAASPAIRPVQPAEPAFPAFPAASPTGAFGSASPSGAFPASAAADTFAQPTFGRGTHERPAAGYPPADSFPAADSYAAADSFPAAHSYAAADSFPAGDPFPAADPFPAGDPYPAAPYSPAHGSGPRPRRPYADADADDASWPGRSTSRPPSQGLTGRLDWVPDAPSPAAPSAAGPRAQQSGGPLPVRQPKPVSRPAALSPSGSLWERAEPSADRPAEAPGSGSRPIYVWNPEGDQDGYSGQNAELAAEAEWGPRWRSS